MSTAQTLVLGALAGSTLLLGLPMGRVRTTDTRVRAALSSLACGILVFLLADVLVHAVEPVEEALTTASDGGSWGTFAGLAVLLGGGLVAGMTSLLYYEFWVGGRRRRSPLIGPGAAAVEEFESRTWVLSLSPARRLALLIATGIGLHNFGEGLAIGQSAAAGETSLALALIIGFGLHNATEGFGIVGPISGEGEDVPSWGFLVLLGLIGGGPTFLGTLVGQAWVSEALAVSFMAVAAGSILYVVQELFNVNRKFGFPV